jgi:hypothetical protein
MIARSIRFPFQSVAAMISSYPRSPEQDAKSAFAAFAEAGLIVNASVAGRQMIGVLPCAVHQPYDIGRANLEHAAALPGLGRLDIPRYLRWIDQAAAAVRLQTERYLYRFRDEPEKYKNSEGVFRMMWLVTILQRDLHVHYRQETIELSDHDFFRDANNLFIHGIIDGKGGTCSSLPVLFAAVGRRLGYPLKLAGCKRHLFLRWDGPGGERFNVETTSRGFVSYPDEYYLKWPFEATSAEVQKYRFLQSALSGRTFENVVMK